MHGFDQDRNGATFADRVGEMAERGIRLAKRIALAFGLAVVSGIGIGAAAADNAFVQILVTVIAAIALWAPILILLLWGERTIGRLRNKPADTHTIDAVARPALDGSWRRLALAAPDQWERVAGLQRSLERSHLRLKDASLDPSAHDLCVLIDKRLPQLIDRELDALPPDDRGRRERIDDLVNLVDRFVRHCSRHGADDGAAAEREAEILRRRFDDMLAPTAFDPQ